MNHSAIHSQPSQPAKKNRGRLRIGNDWNAINIIALSQNNPLKAIAEFVENSIDAQSKNITIVRGREKGGQYLKIVDDGNGIPQDSNGVPDFKYVATHICDSLKKKLKQEGEKNIQGEFGIGLLSFWTVGEKLSIISMGVDEKAYEMVMAKGRSGYEVRKRSHLLPQRGTALTIAPLLSGLRTLNGEKLQRYLAAELRDRIKTSKVQIKVVDRISRMECRVEPREFSGRLLHDMTDLSTPSGDIYVELYVNDRGEDNHIQLFRRGTRVVSNLSALDAFACEPWNMGLFQGILDVPFLNITPGTRDGIIQDDQFTIFCDALSSLRIKLLELSQEQMRAEDEKTSKNILRSVQGALRDALLDLPPEEYDWFDLRAKRKQSGEGSDEESVKNEEWMENGLQSNGENEKSAQKQFFEFPGPLFSAKIRPTHALVPVSALKVLRVIGFDKRRRPIEENLSAQWMIVEGKGSLDKHEGEIVQFSAPEEPGLTQLKAIVKQSGIICETECTLTIVESLINRPDAAMLSKKGLPEYTLENAPGKMWRSRFEESNNLIVINSGHRDFIFASKQRVRKLRYILRLFAKELVVQNFVGMPADQLLERLVELSLYTEEKLK